MSETGERILQRERDLRELAKKKGIKFTTKSNDCPEWGTLKVYVDATVNLEDCVLVVI